ncbi:MAG: META domain-containing protein [Treponema sp.]|nr:META domain-containing protein [Treponema sp.]
MCRYAVFLLFTVTVFACASVQEFSDVQNKDWNLSEIRIKPENITIDRAKLAETGFKEAFTLRFDKERVNGIGAPNRYFAPYLLTEKQGITIKTVAKTLMAAIIEPEGLTEHQFFIYLQNAVKWNLVKGNLELHSKAEDGTEAVLVFTPSGG